MRTEIAMLLLVVLVIGCYSPQRAHEKDLAVWLSADAALEKRMRSAARLVPKGTKQAEAERILGEPTRRERWHGPSVIFRPGQPSIPAAYHDSWHDLYDFANGDYIDFCFDINASPDYWQARPLRSISSGNTRRETQ